MIENKRCANCRSRVDMTERDFEVECLGVDEMVQCLVCKKAEDDLLRRNGLGDCILQKKAFRRAVT